MKGAICPDDRPAAGTGVPAPRARIVAPAVLARAVSRRLPSASGALGLERVEATLASQAVAASVAEFVERYALGASPAVHDLARDGAARVSVAADETTVPPEVAAVVAETVSLFALHLNVNSAGLRYVPLAAPREVPTRGASRRR